MHRKPKSLEGPTPNNSQRNIKRCPHLTKWLCVLQETLYFSLRPKEWNFLRKLLRDSRFICPHEVVWRVFNRPIHYRNPLVQDNEQLHKVVSNPYEKATNLTEWVANNNIDSNDRVTNKPLAIGRLIYVHPSIDEVFYLRIMFSHQKMLGLLGDDNEWFNATEEAAAWANVADLRTLFTHTLFFCEISNPKRCFEK
uniref:Uncharacterized protein n=1 Tax=Lactuca sativa TaxID=4236 RepID=A0A9R1UZZ7_LACSA|nr:hypothetical protein LSAT_V11C700371840 [Lactuca sativa]